MPSPNATPTPITPPRVPLIDPRTGLIDRAWYLFFLSLNNIATNVVDDGNLGSDVESLLSSYDAALRSVNQELQTLPPVVTLPAPDVLGDCCSALVSQTAEMQKQIDGILLQPTASSYITSLGYVTGPASSTDNAIARFDGTSGKIIDNSVVTIDDTGNVSGILSQQFSNGAAVSLAAGKMWYDGSTGAWNLGMGNGNITQQVGEEIFVYGKASAAITDSPLQIIYHTGTVGASGVITFAPTIAGITDVNSIIGIATESLALNGFGRATVFGVVRGITTNGTAFGEVWADDDVIWYNPVTGNPTKVEPVAPYIKVQVGLVIKAGPGGSGSFQVGIARGSKLGGTDSNVQLSAPSNGQILTYDGAATYWKNTTLTAGTGVSISPSAGGVLTVSATGSGGTVTSVSVVSANGFAGTVATSTTTPAITLTTSITGLLKGNGTAISAAVANTDYVPLAAPITKTADYTITGTDTWIINNKTGSALTLTFPAASLWPGRSITVKNLQAQLVNSASSDIVPIDSTVAGTAILLEVVGNWATLVSDGTNWVVMQRAANNCLLLE
jgi:hypothetical protein